MFDIHFEPPIPLPWLATLAVLLVVCWVAIRLALGPPARPARGRGLLTFIRSLALLPLLYVLAGPVWVDEVDGKLDRPDLFFLLDSSQSMDIGKERSRWQEAAGAVESALSNVPADTAGAVQLFEFGHRLTALDATDNAASLSSRNPADTDSRLAEALRQMASRFGRQPPAGVVVFSDGRVRDVDAVRELARYYAERGLPIHVYPPKDLGQGGDIAIVSVVAPPGVRKYSDVPVQVFLRSSGFAGERTEIELVVPERPGQPREVLASIPVTLRGGAQSVALSYRSDMRKREFEVQAKPLPQELSTRNNTVPVTVDIERPKIRVLYIEGSSQPTRSILSIFSRSSQSTTTGPFEALQDALSADEDIECVTLVRGQGSSRLMRARRENNSSTVSGGFPRTQAELSAFDCVILSDAGRELLDEEQIEWLDRWVKNRGGGLLMAGGPDSYAGGGWHLTPLADVLPVRIDASRWTRALNENGIVPDPQSADGLHPVWQIVTEDAVNQSILDQIPGFSASNIGLAPKPIAAVLATGTDGDLAKEPLLVAGNYGRGRSMAAAFPIAPPESEAFMERWGTSGNRYGAKFWRNVVYWLTENSSIGRRRLVATVDKRFYRPGETIQLDARAFDETAEPTVDYSVWGMLEPKTFDFADEDFFSPVHWPDGVPRESGEEGLRIVWGEEFQLPRDRDSGNYSLPLEITERLRGGVSDEGFRIELTAYEQTGTTSSYSHGTQVDSTSVEVQVLDDPFEQQNSFANHDLLEGIATLSGGRVLDSPKQLTALIEELPVEVGPSTIHKTPAWPEWWLLGWLMASLAGEWVYRRLHGLA